MSSYPSVLFLPGSLCDERLFEPQLSHFPEINAKVLKYLPEHDSIASMAESALSLFDGPFHLVGLSMGGIVALDILRKAPDRVQSVALFDTNPRAEKPMNKPFRHQHIDDVTREGRAGLAQLLSDSLKPKYLGDEHADNESIRQRVIDMGLSAGPANLVAQWQALMGRLCSIESLSDICVPTLIGCGEQDALCPVEVHEMMANKIQGSTLLTVPRCGHLITLEAPDQVNKALTALWKL